MSRRRAPSNDDTIQGVDAQPEGTQDAPTAEPVRDENGWELDQWGLPICRPVRVERLAALGLPDPNEDPDAWPTPDQKPDDGDAPEPPADPGVNDVGAVATRNTNANDEESANG